MEDKNDVPELRVAVRLSREAGRAQSTFVAKEWTLVDGECRALIVTFIYPCGSIPAFESS